MNTITSPLFRFFVPVSIIISPLLKPFLKGNREKTSLRIFCCSYHEPCLDHQLSKFCLLCSIEPETTATRGCVVLKINPNPGYIINLTSTSASMILTIQDKIESSCQIKFHSFFNSIFRKNEYM